NLTRDCAGPKPDLRSPARLVTPPATPPSGTPHMPNDSPSAGTQEYVGGDRSAEVFISVNGDLVRRPDAKVSVFDSGFVLGDGVWEGLRLRDGRIAFLDRHFDRLWDGAKMLRIDIGLTREALRARLFDVIEANAMRDGVHIRLMVTR